MPCILCLREYPMYHFHAGSVALHQHCPHGIQAVAIDEKDLGGGVDPGSFSDVMKQYSLEIVTPDVSASYPTLRPCWTWQPSTAIQLGHTILYSICKG